MCSTLPLARTLTAQPARSLPARTPYSFGSLRRHRQGPPSGLSSCIMEAAYSRCAGARPEMRAALLQRKHLRKQLRIRRLH